MQTSPRTKLCAPFTKENIMSRHIWGLTEIMFLGLYWEFSDPILIIWRWSATEVQQTKNFIVYIFDKELMDMSLAGIGKKINLANMAPWDTSKIGMTIEATDGFALHQHAMDNQKQHHSGSVWTTSNLKSTCSGCGCILIASSAQPEKKNEG